VLRIARQVAEGLAAAHERGLIHRDVKPSNIWLEAGRDRIKILDFGLARQATGTDEELSHSGLILGTPAYMAPEQAGGATLDSRCDLFSLGSVIYRMCAGVLPFKGANAIAILQALALDTPKPLNEVNPEAPPALASLVARLLSKDPDGRPKSAREVVEALQAIERTPLPPPSGGGMSLMQALDSAQLEPLESELTPRPNVARSSGPLAGQSKVGKPQHPGSSRTEATSPAAASQTSKSPGPGGSGKQRRPGASSTVKSPALSESQSTKSPGASSSGSTKTPKGSKPALPEATPWDDMPVLPSRSKTMRRLYRRQNEEWVPLAVGTAVVTALIIGVVAIIRLLLAR